jgi:hypothetical protein
MKKTRILTIKIKKNNVSQNIILNSKITNAFHLSAKNLESHIILEGIVNPAT